MTFRAVGKGKEWAQLVPNKVSQTLAQSLGFLLRVFYCKGDSSRYARKNPKFIKYNDKYSSRRTYARKNPKRKP